MSKGSQTKTDNQTPGMQKNGDGKVTNLISIGINIGAQNTIYSIFSKVNNKYSLLPIVYLNIKIIKNKANKRERKNPKIYPRIIFSLLIYFPHLFGINNIPFSFSTNNTSIYWPTCIKN